MTALDDSFVARARANSQTITVDGRDVLFRASSARAGLIRAELEVLDDDGVVLGFVTPYSDSEHGAQEERFFGVGLPTLFRSAEDAASYLLNRR